MSSFLTNAESILATAENNPDGTNWTILTGAPGGIRMIANSDWPLDSLQADSGADAVYRIHRHAGHVTVEGRSARQSCALRSDPPAQVARFLLGSTVAMSYCA